MATLTIKDLPDELYEWLRKSAQANGRSINREAVMILEKFLRIHRLDPRLIQIRAARLREMTAHYVIAVDELEEWINTDKN